MKKTISFLLDNPALAKQLEAALWDLGYLSFYSASAQQVMTACAKSPPDFVVTDFDALCGETTVLCRALRADPRNQSLPIFVMSQQKLAALFGTVLDLGAQGVASGNTAEQFAQDLLVLMEKRRPHLPFHEKKRLSTLRSLKVLDTPNDPVLDELVAVAAAVTEAPIAVVSLVDEKRQWFKARVGLLAMETPREHAFCAHAIHGEDIFEVPDALQDRRFVRNPLVTAEPRIRFYAGAPLVSKTGTGLGTLCVIDRQPRQLSPVQREILRRLGRAATLILER